MLHETYANLKLNIPAQIEMHDDSLRHFFICFLFFLLAKDYLY